MSRIRLALGRRHRHRHRHRHRLWLVHRQPAPSRFRGGLVAQDSHAMIRSLAGPAKCSPSMPKIAGAHVASSCSHFMCGTLAGNPEISGMAVISHAGKMGNTGINPAGSSASMFVDGPFMGTMIPTLAGATKNPGMPSVPNTGTMSGALADYAKCHGMPGMSHSGGLVTLSQTMSSPLAYNASSRIPLLSHSGTMSGALADYAKCHGMPGMLHSGGLVVLSQTMSSPLAYNANSRIPLLSHSVTSPVLHFGGHSRSIHAGSMSGALADNAKYHGMPHSGGLGAVSQTMTSPWAFNARSITIPVLHFVSGTFGGYSRSIHAGSMSGALADNAKYHGMPRMSHSGGLVALSQTMSSPLSYNATSRIPLLSHSVTSPALHFVSGTFGGHSRSIHAGSVSGALADNAKYHGMPRMSHSGGLVALSRTLSSPLAYNARSSRIPLLSHSVTCPVPHFVSGTLGGHSRSIHTGGRRGPLGPGWSSHLC